MVRDTLRRVWPREMRLERQLRGEQGQAAQSSGKYAPLSREAVPNRTPGRAATQRVPAYMSSGGGCRRSSSVGVRPGRC